jgi:hypothetical protein
LEIVGLLSSDRIAEILGPMLLNSGFLKTEILVVVGAAGC